MSDEAAAPGEPLARDLLADADAFPIAATTARWETPLLHTFALPRYVRPTMPVTIAEHSARPIEVHERELPSQLYADLRELAPQALLRDLYRPVQSFYVQPEVREGTEALGLLHEELERVRAARRREPLPVIEPSVAAVIESQATHRALVDPPWKPLLADDAERTKIQLYPDVPDDDAPPPRPPRFEVTR